MNENAEAGHAALQILEAIRATHPDLIADNVPPGWGMNRLRAALHEDSAAASAPEQALHPATGGINPEVQAKAVWRASEAAGRLMLPKDVKLVASCIKEGGQTCLVFPDGSAVEILGLTFDRIYWGEEGVDSYNLAPYK